MKENEWWTSSKCSRCGSKVESNKRRVTCNTCGVQYDREFNSTVNIALKGIPLLGDKSFLEKAGATVDIARIADESLYTGGVRNLMLQSEALPL
ncbi:MAG: transposase [Candidatus Altiarchaeota archaeon]|nr:transposase [Candidatus Altiarchaeota archaeon]